MKKWYENNSFMAYFIKKQTFNRIVMDFILKLFQKYLSLKSVADM
jgi:hypothetical protein